jgi:hypothetical protein
MLIVPISVFVHADPSAPASMLPEPPLVADEEPLPPVLLLPLVPVLLLVPLVPLAPVLLLPVVLLVPLPVLLLPLPVFPLPVPVSLLPLPVFPLPVPVLLLPLLLPPLLPVLLWLDPSVLFPAELPPLLAHAEIRAAARPATEAPRNASCAHARGACRIRLVDEDERDSLADIAKDLRGSDGAAACPGLYDTPDDSGIEIARFRRRCPRIGRHFRRTGRRPDEGGKAGRPPD